MQGILIYIILLLLKPDMPGKSWFPEKFCGLITTEPALESELYGFYIKRMKSDTFFIPVTGDKFFPCFTDNSRDRFCYGHTYFIDENTADKYCY